MSSPVRDTEATAPPSLQGPDQPSRILIVDDERPDRQLLEVMLASEGFALSTAASGEEALAMLAQQPFDLVLLDVRMTGLDGCQVTARIKADRATQRIPVIMVTALDDREARMLGLRAGAEDFLSKPVDRAELRVRVRNLLRLKAYGESYDKYSQMLEGEVVARTADLLERTTTLEALRRQYALVLDSIADGVYGIDVAGRITIANKVAAEMFGWNGQEIVGHHVHQAIHHSRADGSPYPEAECPILTTLRDGEMRRITDEAFWRTDGTSFPVEYLAAPMRDAGGAIAGAVVTFRDVTARREAERQRRESEAQLLQSQKMESIGRLAGGIAHDFNNLLGVILGYGALLLGKARAGPDRTKLEQIVKAGERAAGLTRQLLAFSRKQVLEPRVLDLNELVVDMEKMLRRLIGEDIQLSTLLTGLGHVKADPGQIEQVLMNLVVNARDAMPRGGRLTIQTSDVVHDECYAAERPDARPGPCVMLSVSDTGVGMTPETQLKIFEPFFTTKGPSEGTGLGLATSDGIVRQSGGHIAVDSELGRGSTFKVYLPRIDEELRGDVAAPAAPSLGSETILLAEDEPALRELTRELLEERGYTVIEAGSGDGALKRAGEYSGEIDLLLTDVVMPRMSGRELAERLARSRPGLRVMFMSGYTDDAVVRHGVLAPSVAFIQKPFGAESLLAKVREALQQ